MSLEDQSLGGDEPVHASEFQNFVVCLLRTLLGTKEIGRKTSIRIFALLLRDITACR